jgi:hypothetical protein
MELAIYVLFGLALGMFMYRDAKRRGLDNPSTWIWIGALFSLLGLATYWYWHVRAKPTPTSKK